MILKGDRVGDIRIFHGGFFQSFDHPHLLLYPSLQGSGVGVRLENHCFKAIELCRGTHDLELTLLSYWLHTSMMELQSKNIHLRDTFKIIYNFVCKIHGCWINVASVTETILTDGLCPRERHR